VRGLEETCVVTEVLDENEVLGEDGRLAGFKELVEGVQGYEEEAGVNQVPSLSSLNTARPPTSLERIVLAVLSHPKDHQKPIQSKQIEVNITRFPQRNTPYTKLTSSRPPS
jgi:hypothetical protein